MYGVLEGPHVHFVHCLVVDVGRHRSIATSWVAVKFLFVSDEMLDASDDAVLHALDGLESQTASKVGVIAETFPVATTFGHSSERSNNRSKEDIDTLGFELSAHIVSSLVSKVSVPCGTNVNSRSKSSDTICSTETISSIAETETREANSGC